VSASLRELVDRGLALAVWGDADVVVRGVRHDSRAVEAGDLFVAMPGRNVDGSRFAAEALARGAVALAVEHRLELGASPLHASQQQMPPLPVPPLHVPQLHVRDARAALGRLAAAVYGEPTRSLHVVGITGTNGKTTTSWIVEEALSALGETPALLGTVESRGPGMREPAPYTTPEGDAIARFARRALDAGATHLVMEVSSHALAQRRADAVAFEVAAFTNLSQDHLDFHGTMEAYFEAKARLFTELAPRRSVVLIDDPWGASLASRLGGACLRVSRQAALRVPPGSRGADVADLVVREATMDRDGIRARVAHEGAEVELASAMIGAHNLDNLLVALGILRALGVPLADAARALGQAKGAPGRLERVEGLPEVRVLVDYAHTPDALTRALAALRPITPGRLWVVFGCGGDRDRGKRPPMGEAAGHGADLALVTSDNPRTEDPHAILAAIEPGVIAAGMRRVEGSDLASAARAYDVCEDRAEAIRRAIAGARPGDTVLIAGKGHEDYQIRGTTKHHFDDREQAREAMRALAARGASASRGEEA
jgi:UDP-N-acetylmuramoyl-L-alanyl-D-glutamate--2,6-diaminopimelate ligase